MRLLRGQAFPITSATLVLFVVSPVLVNGSLGGSAMATVLPFAAILAVASIGQTLVVQQRGMDFSVAGVVSLSAVVFARVADQQDGRIPVAVAAALGAGALVGALNAVAIVVIRIPALVATLGSNALVLGMVQQVSGGISVVPGPPGLTTFALDEIFGIPKLVLLVASLLAVAEFVTRLTVAGRHFVATGSNPKAARAAGVHVSVHVTAAYVIAGCVYAFAGVLLVGLLVTPGLAIGNPFLLSTIAAVVVGGTSLQGGTGSVIASAIGALFLTQLAQLLFAAGYGTAVNYLVQGAVIGASMLLPRLVTTRPFRRVAPPEVASGSVQISPTQPALELNGTRQRSAG